MAQTAVEWLYSELTNTWYDEKSSLSILEQAKQIEKEQITDAYIMGSYDMVDKEFRPEQYYNEIFNK